MSNDRMDKMEGKIDGISRIVYTIEASIGSIVKNIEDALSVKDEVVTHTEKHKVTEARLSNLEKHDVKMDDKVNNINIKIALATGVWAVVYFIGKEFISKM